MDEQRKLPLEEDKPRLKLSIENSNSRNQEDPIQEPDETSDANGDEELSVGAHLRRERERQGLSLHDVAEKLRLRAKQLQALEEGDYESLPGQTFVTGFIRSYASTLRLDAVAVVNLYKRENDIGRRAPDLAFPEPTPEGRMPGVGLLMGSSLVALLLFAGWYFYYKDNAPDLEIVQELPQRLLEKITGSNDELPETTAGAGTTSVVAEPSEGNTVPSDGSATVEALKPEIMSSQPSGEDASVVPSVVAEVTDQPSNEITTVEPSAVPEVSAQAGTDAVQENAADVPEDASIVNAEKTLNADIETVNNAVVPVNEAPADAVNNSNQVQAGTDVVQEATTEAPGTAPVAAVEKTLEANAESTSSAAATVTESSTVEIASRPAQPVPDVSAANTEASTNNETLPEADVTVEPLPSDAAEATSLDRAEVTVAQKPTVEVEASDAAVSTGFQQLRLPEQASPAAAEEPSTAEPVTLGMENATARLVLVANQESWVQVSSSTGETILDRIMEAGDTFMLPNGPTLTLSTANGSGLELRLDGEVLGTLGAYGQIVRNLSLEPEALKEKFGAEN